MLQGVIAKHDYFIEVFPGGLYRIIVNTPFMQEQTLPKTAIIPVTATGRHYGFIGGKSVQVIYPTACSLQTLTVGISTDIVVKGSDRVEIKFRDVAIPFFFGLCIAGFFFQKPIA